MSQLVPAAGTTAIDLRVKASLGSNWKYVTGEPLSYQPYQVTTVWRGIPSIPAPLELLEVTHIWTVEVTATSAEPNDALDAISAAWVALRDAWKTRDNICLGGICQESWWSSVVRAYPEAGGAQYPGLLLTLSVIDKTPDTFS